MTLGPNIYPSPNFTDMHTIPGLNEFRAQLAKTDAADVPYEPAITTVHLPIDCRLYRVPGVKTGRMHHLLGYPEYINFLKEDMSDALNLREQFGIPQELSLFVANELGIKHPYVWKEKRLSQMTVDLMVTNADGTWTGVDCKPADKLKQKRVSEKLTLMAAILGHAGIPHVIRTGAEITSIPQANYEILHPLATAFDPPPFRETDMARASATLRRLLVGGTRSLRQAAAHCESETGLARGQSIRSALWLIANRRWQVDLSVRIAPDEPVKFLPRTKP
jgi:hypothetical protein